MIAQVYTAIRDRPRLRLDAHSTASLSKPPAVFECPTAKTYAAESQRCTKGEQVVTWRVEFR
jgi:hypothetical protein